MTLAAPEMTVLALGALLVLVQIAIASAAKTRDLGTDWNLGPRDAAPEPGPRAARLERALANMLQTFPVFVAAVLVVAATGASSGLTAACAWIWLIARVVYIPLYAAGISPWRSVAWLIATVALTVMLIATLV